MYSVVETVGKMMPRMPRLLCDTSVIMVKSVESKWLFMEILGIRIPFTGKNEYPLLWFDNPEHIVINAQPSSLSLQDGKKKTLFERIFNLIFDLMVLAFGLIFIYAGTSFLFWQVIDPVTGETGFALLIFLVFTGMGVFVILKFIERKRVLTIDRTNNKVKFEYVRWPRYGTINYQLRTPISYEIIVKKRTITHHEGGDEGTPSRTWTTTHRGVDVAFDLVGEGKIPLLFLEGKKPKTKFKSILELLSSTLGIKDEEDGQ